MFGGERLFGDRVARVVGEVDAHLAEVSPLLRMALVLLFDVLRLLPILVLRRLTLFEFLSPPEQHTFLEAVERSPRLGLPLLPYKTLLTIAFYELPGELESVGYGKLRRRYLLAPPHDARPR